MILGIKRGCSRMNTGASSSYISSQYNGAADAP